MCLSCLEGDEFGTNVSKTLPFNRMLISQACILFRGVGLKTSFSVLKLFLWLFFHNQKVLITPAVVGGKNCLSE